MNQSFYIGAVGAQQQQLRLNVQGNNIANVNTYGFKAEKGRFSSLLYQNMVGIDEAQLPAGVGARLMMTSTDFNQGGAATTGRMQDYMIEGDGFFALMDMETGEVSFTRNGSFSPAEYIQVIGTDANGEPMTQKIMCLSDGDGRFVLSYNGTMIEVDDPEAEYPVGIFDYANYNGMEHISGTRFLPVEKNGDLVALNDPRFQQLGADGVAQDGPRLHQGVLELSNVDLAEEITKVIESQRAYSLALRMVTVSDDIENTINTLRA